MYTITIHSYGLEHTFSGNLDHEEIKEWLSDSMDVLFKLTNKDFVVLIDMRGVESITRKGATLLKGLRKHSLTMV